MSIKNLSRYITEFQERHNNGWLNTFDQMTISQSNCQATTQIRRLRCVMAETAFVLVLIVVMVTYGGLMHEWLSNQWRRLVRHS